MVTLNRPAALNAVTLACQRMLDDVLTELNGDRDVRCIVLTAVGDRAFCAGYDLHEMADWDEDQMMRALVAREELIWRWVSTPLPVIVALNGIAYGFGAILASAVDIRFGCSEATMRFTAGRYGGANATWLLPDLVGRGRATEILMSARPVTSSEAERIGLLDRVLPRPELLPAALETATVIASYPPAGVRAIKRLVREHEGHTVERRFAAENHAMRTELRPGRIRDLYDGFLGRSEKNIS